MPPDDERTYVHRMTTTIARQGILLRLTLADYTPEIWREVSVDAASTLADLRRIITRLFDCVDCHHHVFTDVHAASSWSPRRRWGDRWTMIDFRDPTVIDEETASVERALRETGVLTFSHSCRTRALVTVETISEVEIVSTRPRGTAEVHAGSRSAPLPCCHGALEHDMLARVLADSTLALHDTLAAALETTLGPWASYTPDSFDPVAAQRALDDSAPRPPATARAWRATTLDHLKGRLPRLARAGFDQHIVECALNLPPVVTADDAHQATEQFGWIIACASTGGIELVDGAPDPEVLRAGSEAFACDVQDIVNLIALARRAHLLYSRGGRLHANKRAIAASTNPVQLWTLLARDLIGRHRSGSAGDLLLLAIADGSLANRAIGARASARVLASLRGMPQDHSWMDGDPRDKCDQECDCPRVAGETWHEIVARSVRAAAADAARGNGAPLVAGEIVDESEFPSDWWGEAALARARGGEDASSDTPIDDNVLLAEAAALVELLEWFGLDRTVDGHWIVPSPLRELAREALRSAATHYGPF